MTPNAIRLAVRAFLAAQRAKANAGAAEPAGDAGASQDDREEYCPTTATVACEVQADYIDDVSDQIRAKQ